MSELERAAEQKKVLYQRYREAREAYLAAADPAERRAQGERSRLLRDMYQEACAEARRLSPDRGKAAPRGKKGKGGKPPARLESVMACGALWADLEGATWSKLEGRTWDEPPAAATGRQAKAVQELVGAGMAACTDRQAHCLRAYYARGLTLEEIGEELGVDPSTVSRTLKRGRERIERLVAAKLLLGKCVDKRGLFDYQLFLNSARVLTERQKELVYLLLARDTSCRDIAGYIGRTPSAVSRTAERAEEKLSALAVTVDGSRSAVRVERGDWSGRSEKELAEDLGLSPAFYYRVVRRGEGVDGAPLLHCAILRRLSAGQEPERIGKELGCAKGYVKRVARLYRGVEPPPFTEDYRPRAQRRARLPENPFVMLGGGGAVMDRIDAATYQKLQERFGGEAHAGA